jgi:hypothetical protein
MAKILRLQDLRDALTSRAELNRAGVSDSAIRKHVHDGILVRVHHGWFASADLMRDLYPEQRHAMAVLAAHADGTAAIGAMMGISAASLHALPLWGLGINESVHVLLRGTRLSSGAVVRHSMRYEPEDIIDVDGVLCTTMARTVFDIACARPFAMAVACADAAMRTSAMDDGVYAEQRAEEFRARLTAVIARMPGARGLARAQQVARFADGRAESPGESVTRARALEVGFRTFEVQLPVRSPSGGWFFGDVGLPEVNALLEFDGAGKYLSGELAGDRPIADVVLNEKRREDWIRATTRRTVIRVAARDVAGVASFRAMLRSHQIDPPR